MTTQLAKTIDVFSSSGSFLKTYTNCRAVYLDQTVFIVDENESLMGDIKAKSTYPAAHTRLEFKY